MKSIKTLTVAALLTGFLASPFTGQTAETKDDKTTAKPKPYLLKTCIVSDEKLGGDMGEPYVFTHEGREIKLCCKSCLKDFNKATAKFVKKLDAAEKKAKKS
jgi:hypothetical protein